MRRAVILCGTASFVMAFLGGILAFSLMAPSSATAQSSQAQEVRASAFVLVAEDGTVLARLAPNEPPAGSGLRPVGQLTLNNSSGTRRLTVNGGGALAAYDQDGAATVFRAGYTVVPGAVPLNGVQLSADGAIRMLPD